MPLLLGSAAALLCLSLDLTINLSRYLMALSTRVFFLAPASSFNRTNPNCVLSSSDKTCNSTVVNVLFESCLVAACGTLFETFDFFGASSVEVVVAVSVDKDSVTETLALSNDVDVADDVVSVSMSDLVEAVVDVVVETLAPVELDVVDVTATGDFFVALNLEDSTFVIVSFALYRRTLLEKNKLLFFAVQC